jgi:hypothetical protein
VLDSRRAAYGGWVARRGSPPRAQALGRPTDRPLSGSAAPLQVMPTGLDDPDAIRRERDQLRDEVTPPPPLRASPYASPVKRNFAAALPLTETPIGRGAQVALLHVKIESNQKLLEHLAAANSAQGHP